MAIADGGVDETDTVGSHDRWDWSNGVVELWSIGFRNFRDP
jgi:hypothetical protein